MLIISFLVGVWGNDYQIIFVCAKRYLYSFVIKQNNSIKLLEDIYTYLIIESKRKRAEEKTPIFLYNIFSELN